MTKRAGDFPDGFEGLVLSTVIRDPALRAAMRAVRTERRSPSEGDVVLVEALDDDGAYAEVDTPDGGTIRLKAGDRLVAVMATRKSSTSIYASLPFAVQAGSVVDLVAKAGLVAQAISTPAYLKRLPLRLRVIGTVADESGRALNIGDYQRLSVPHHLAPPKDQVVFVCGTAAEVGKTTLVCHFISALRLQGSIERIGAIKACGTGRLADSLRHRGAGADVLVDFVDAGWPTTYNMSAAQYQSVLSGMVGRCLSQRCDWIFVEIGGDLLEGHADSALDFAAAENCPTFVVVSDALAGRAALSLLAKRRVRVLAAAVLNRNSFAIAERIGVKAIIDINDHRSVSGALAPLVGAPVRVYAQR